MMATQHIRRPNGFLRRTLRASYKGVGRLAVFSVKLVATGFLVAAGAALAVLWGITQASGGDITKVLTEVSLSNAIDLSGIELPPVTIEQEPLELSEVDRALLRALIEAQGGIAP